MEVRVAKFGGTSVANADQVRKTADIVKSDPRRRVIVVSAPGKRSSEDEKITDILISCHELAGRGDDFRGRFAAIRSRFHSLADELGIGRDMDGPIDQVERDIADGADANQVVSRGEYLGAHMVARFLGFEFVDAADLIEFRSPTVVDNETTDKKIGKRLSPGGKYVIPGFYGARPDGEIQLFTRGGSDISASLVARGIGADLYENWTDVSGLLSADPRIVDNPAPIASVSYRELRELAFLGAAVFHEDAVAPAADRGIPINIRNTNAPDHPGTMIAASGEHVRQVCGVAGRRGFRLIHLEKPMLDKDAHFAESFEALLTGRGAKLVYRSLGCDSLYALASGSAGTDWRALAEDFRERLACSRAETGTEAAIVGAAGENISRNAPVLAGALAALDREGIPVLATRADYSPCSLMFVVPDERYAEALGAIYGVGSW